jgi:hypothetical protein
LLTDTKDSTATKKEKPLFDKIITSGGGPVLWALSPDTVKWIFEKSH